MPARAAARISASCGIVSAGASRKSLSSAKWMFGSTLPRAWTSRWAISSCDALDAVEDRRHDHHRAGVGRDGHQFEPRQPPWRDQIADDPLHDLDRQLAGRHGREQRDPGQHRAPPAMLVGARSGPRRPGPRCRARSCRGSRSRVPEEQAADRRPSSAGLQPMPCSNGLTAAADQVVADVGAALGRGHARPPDARVRRSSAPGAAGASPVGSAISSTAWR